MTTAPRPIRKAVFPVAGLGTRFLPATKAMPKEMLTVVDRPVIQYAVDEARAAGIEHFIFVTGRNKAVIEDHFDVQVELEDTLRARGKTIALDQLERDLPAPGTTSFTRQQAPLGLGHAVWCARDLVGNEPFALLLPDMVMQSDIPCLADMRTLYNEMGGNVVSLKRCAPELTHRYGIVGVDGPVAGRQDAYAISEMIEKPAPEEAPSNLYLTGRYILQPGIFDILGQQKIGAGGEIQLTDAMVSLMEQSQAFYGHEFKGQIFDCGSKIGFLAANVAFALQRSDIEGDFKGALQDILNAQ